MKTTAAALVLAAALTACSSLPQPPEQPATWDLGAPPALQAAAAQGAALALGSIRTVPTFDGDAISYRLLYAADGDLQPRPYANSRWAAPIPHLLAQRLQQHLAASRPVLDAGNGRLAPLELRLALDEFAQHFASEQSSSGVIQLRATLMGGQPRRLIAQRNFATSANAPTPDAPGGVQALRAAADTLAKELDGWLRQYDAAPAIQLAPHDTY